MVSSVRSILCEAPGQVVGIHTFSLLALNFVLLLTLIPLPFTLQSLQDFLMDLVSRFYTIFFFFSNFCVASSQSQKWENTGCSRDAER